MYDLPQRNGFHLPESPRITSLLSGLMGSPDAPIPAPAALAGVEPELIGFLAKADEMAFAMAPASNHPPRTAAASPVSEFFQSINWAYVPSAAPPVAVTPQMPVREFFAQVNWPGLASPGLRDADLLAIPPSVEGFMSQCAWD